MIAAIVKSRYPKTIYFFQPTYTSLWWQPNYLISEMEIGLAVGGAFLSSASNVLFDRLTLKECLDNAENLIEEVNYKTLRLKEKLEDSIETLEVLEKKIGRLRFQKHFGPSKEETIRPSTSLVDEFDILGRHNEIEGLVDRLLFEDANLTVVPIFGMGSVGKTTLGRAVYNDEKVKNHFDLEVWFGVSEPYDPFRITKGLLQVIGIFDRKVGNNLNQLQVKLKENLKGKKFLIILDDV
ncbi:putative disease resistance RPP13-like protein 1-like [Capsicum annuum]|nr:putative disease resistance RPP13-like protein 1-like [Capsicum annuum]KAF3662701.1 putative disease resistance RPP13-like protein 1-like [Capsicum annuum]